MSKGRQALPRGSHAFLEAHIDSHLISEWIRWQNLISQVVTLVTDPSWVWLFPVEVQKITFDIHVPAVWSPFSHLHVSDLLYYSVHFLMARLFCILHNYRKPEAMPKLPLGLRTAETLWILMNLEIILLPGRNNFQSWAQVEGSLHPLDCHLLSKLYSTPSPTVSIP